jgi:hypothetical protein
VTTIAGVAAACLRVAGCDRVLHADVVGDAYAARRLAEAEGRLAGLGAAIVDDHTLYVTGGPSAVGVHPVDHPRDLAEAIAHAASRALAPVPAATDIVCDFPLGDAAPATLAPIPPERPSRWIDPPATVVEAIEGARAPVVLAGPGVVRAGCVAGLHALAARRSLGVLNTWGAKGVFDWRSPHHLATAGLQARDFELAGFGDADLVVAVGVDPSEARGFELAPVVAVEPGMLDPLADALEGRSLPIPRPPLFGALAGPTQAAWAQDAAPLPPTRITRLYAEVLGPGALVAADPGTAGFWLARTFATTELGSVQVPGWAGSAGFAVAAAVVARVRAPARPVLAVVDAPLDDGSRAVLDAAAAMGVAVAVDVWDLGGQTLDAGDRRVALAAAVTGSAGQACVLASGYDPAQLDDFVAAAGRVVAWEAA